MNRSGGVTRCGMGAVVAWGLFGPAILGVAHASAAAASPEQHVFIESFVHANRGAPLLRQWGLTLGLRSHELWEFRLGLAYQARDVVVRESGYNGILLGTFDTSLQTWTPEFGLRMSPRTKSLVQPLLQVSIGVPISEGPGSIWGADGKLEMFDLTGLGFQLSSGVGAGLLIRDHVRAQFLVGYMKEWTRWATYGAGGNKSKLPMGHGAGLDSQAEQVTLRIELGWQF